MWAPTDIIMLSIEDPQYFQDVPIFPGKRVPPRIYVMRGGVPAHSSNLILGILAVVAECLYPTSPIIKKIN